MSNKPDFIVDPHGTVRDVRGQKYHQDPVVLQPPSPGTGSAKSRFNPAASPKFHPAPYVILIPIGLIITLIVALARAIHPSQNRTVSFSADTSDLYPGPSQLYKGNISLENGNYEVAIQYFNLYLQEVPDSGEAYNSRGLAYHMKGENDQALADLEKASQLAPRNASPLSNRGAVYISMGNYENAMAELDKAIAMNDQHAIAYYNRGLVHLNLGNYDRAIADFDQAILLTPESAVKSSPQKQTTPDSPSSSKMVIQTNWNDDAYADLPLAYLNRGNIYLYKGKYNQAINDFDKAIHFQPDFTSAYYSRGLANKLSGNLFLAIADFKKVIELNNDPLYLEDAKARLEELER